MGLTDIVMNNWPCFAAVTVPVGLYIVSHAYRVIYKLIGSPDDWREIPDRLAESYITLSNHLMMAAALTIQKTVQEYIPNAIKMLKKIGNILDKTIQHPVFLGGCGIALLRACRIII